MMRWWNIWLLSILYCIFPCLSLARAEDSPGNCDLFLWPLAYAITNEEFPLAELELPLTPKLIEALTTVDGTLKPLLESAGANARRFLQQQGKDYLLDPTRQRSTVSTSDFQILLSALHRDVTDEKFLSHGGRIIPGLIVQHHRPANALVQLAPYVEWASAYDYKETEIELHVDALRIDVNGLVEFTRQLSIDFTDKAEPMHLQIPALAPTPDVMDFRDFINMVFSNIVFFAQTSLLYELSAVEAGEHLRTKNQSSQSILFSPLRKEEMRLLIRTYIYKASGRALPSNLQEISTVKGFVGIKMPGFYRDPNLWAIELRFVGAPGFTRLDPIVEIVKQRSMDFRGGFDESFFDHFENLWQHFYQVPNLKPELEADRIKAIATTMDTVLGIYSGHSLEMYQRVVNNNLDWHPKVFETIERNGSLLSAMKPRFTEFIKLYGEIEFLFSPLSHQVFFNKDVRQQIIEAQAQGRSRLFALIDGGSIPGSRETAAEISAVMRSFLFQSNLLPLLEKVYQELGKTAATRNDELLHVLKDKKLVPKSEGE